MNRIKKIRNEYKLTIRALEKLTGIPNSTISEAENGKRTLTDDVATKLANYFNVSVEYLKGETLIDRLKRVLTDLKRDYTFTDEWSPEPQIKEDNELDERDKNLILAILKLNELTLDNIKKARDYIDLLYNDEHKITLEDFDD